jgi:hypothetical protein
MTSSDPRDLWVAFDDRWHVVDISPAAALGGRTPADCLGHSLWELRPVVTGRPLERALLEAAASRTPFGPAVLTAPDGQPFEVEIVPGTGRTLLRATPVAPGTGPAAPHARDAAFAPWSPSTTGDRRASRDRRRSFERRLTLHRRRSG